MGHYTHPGGLDSTKIAIGSNLDRARTAAGYTIVHNASHAKFNHETTCGPLVCDANWMQSTTRREVLQRLSGGECCDFDEKCYPKRGDRILICPNVYAKQYPDLLEIALSEISIVGIMGVVTDSCVRTVAEKSLELGKKPIILSDCTAQTDWDTFGITTNPTPQEAVLQDIRSGTYGEIGVQTAREFFAS